MTEFISNLIGNDFWATLIMSFIPLIELKGGIVFARGVGFGFFKAFLLSYLGSTIVFVPVYFLLKPILKLLKKIKGIGKLAEKIESYFEKKAEETLQKAEKNKSKKERSATFYKKLGVFIFVAIPLPMTGVWTGTAVSVFLDMDFKDVVLPIIIGNMVAGIIISLIALLCLAVWSIEALDYILWGLFALAVILFAITVIKVVRSDTKKKEE